MDIKQSQPPKNHTSLAGPETSTFKLKLSQQIEVKIIDSKNNNHSIEIKLPQSNKSLQLQSNIPLTTKNGQTLELLVTKATIPIEFKVLNDKGEAKNIILKQLILPAEIQKNISQPLVLERPLTDKAPASHLEASNTKQPLNSLNPQQTILNALKQAIPTQEPPAVLLNQIISQLPHLNQNKTLPDTLKQLAQEILNNLPDKKSLHNPQQLKKLIANSGAFMESKLAQSLSKDSLNIQTDFKSQLLKLHQALSKELNTTQNPATSPDTVELLKEMQQKTESALAKIILNQLTSLPKDDGTKQVWVTDLPFLDKNFPESVRIEINRKEQGDNNEDDENWAVDITITPPDLATIHCKISYYDKMINTRFWSDEQQVVKTINNQLDRLKKQFESVGINPGHMSAHTGIPKTETQQQTMNQSSFDQQA